MINPIIGNSFGVSSVLFLVAWHFLLYMTAELIEFSPAIAEWAGWRRLVREVTTAACPVVSWPYMAAAEMPMPCCPRCCLRE